MNTKFLKNFQLHLSFSTSLLSIVVLSLLLTVYILALQTSGAQALIISLKESSYLPILLNFLPIFFVMTLIYLISNQLALATGLTCFFVILMGIINRFKIVFRQDPFMPWDIWLGGELVGISKSFSPKLIIGSLGGLLALIVVFTLLFFVIKNQKLSYSFRIAGAIVTCAIALLCNRFLYKNAALNQYLHVEGNIFNRVDQYNSRGFLYSFLYELNTTKITKPEGYQKREIEEKIAASRFHSKTLNGVKPHVFVIMGEAFSDLALADGLSFEGYTDPLENYKSIVAESMSGYIVTPNLGGGTADTEFDALTGINTRNFRGVPYSYMLVKKNISSLASILTTLGYDNTAIHPGHPWFYNRLNVYPFLGFQNFIHLKQFDEADNKGMYINETVTISRILDDFENHRIQRPGQPYFSFCVTIQNHGPYPNKYLSDTNFQTDLDLTSEDINALSNYFEGVSDSDRELKRLTDTFTQLDEPVVLMYFGDHLPALSQNAYEALIPHGPSDSLEELTRLYRTPYIIWHNPAAQGLLEEPDPRGTEDIISSHYLGGLLLKKLRYAQYDPYFSENCQMLQKYPVILEKQYFDAQGVLHNRGEETPEDLQFFMKWEYYKLFE